MVTYRVTGKVTHIVEADSQEEAEKKADAFATDDSGEDYSEAMFDLEEVDDVDGEVNRMYHVLRDGREIKTTYVRASDVRLEPEEEKEPEDAEV
jgi:hypothetical protein